MRKGLQGERGRQGLRAEGARQPLSLAHPPQSVLSLLFLHTEQEAGCRAICPPPPQRPAAAVTPLPLPGSLS